MKVAGDFTFDAPPNMVWEALLDPTVLTQVLPGCERLDKTGDDEYEGALNIKVGPVQGTFQGKIKLEDIEEPHGYTMRVDGRGAPGFVRATAKVRLAAEGDGTTMTYDSDAQVGGRIASVGQRLLDSSAKAIIKQSLEALNALIKARSAAEEGAAVAVEAPAAPTQAEFAAQVAKEVAKDLIPPGARVAIAVGAVVLILILVWLLAF